MPARKFARGRLQAVCFGKAQHSWSGTGPGVGKSPTPTARRWFHGLFGVRAQPLCDLLTGQGAAAMSLCMFSSSRSESGQTAGGKSEPSRGSGKVAASHPLPSLGRGFPGAGRGADSREPPGERCPKDLLAFGGLSTHRDVPQRLAPPTGPLPFHRGNHGQRISLTFPLFLHPSLPSLLLPHDHALVKSVRMTMIECGRHPHSSGTSQKPF